MVMTTLPIPSIPRLDYTLLGGWAKNPQHRIEECLQRSKSETGLADYEVRNWTGWQHHQTLSLLATWFLVRETQRGKNMDPCHNATADSPRHRGDLARGVSGQHDVADGG
jgi:hypothetical protein